MPYLFLSVDDLLQEEDVYLLGTREIHVAYESKKFVP
jgi:hypothetical protein